MSSNKALSEKAVHACRLYLGSQGFTDVKTETKFYQKMMKAFNALVSAHGGSGKVDTSYSYEQMFRIAGKRGAIKPVPGKDF